MITKCPICRTPINSFLKWKDDPTPPVPEGEPMEPVEKKEEESVVVEIDDKGDMEKSI
jgi:hypothetical protein